VLCKVLMPSKGPKTRLFSQIPSGRLPRQSPDVSIFILVQRPTCIGYDCDLAILEVDDPEFWAELPIANFRFVAVLDTVVRLGCHIGNGLPDDLDWVLLVIVNVGGTNPGLGMMSHSSMRQSRWLVTPWEVCFICCIWSHTWRSKHLCHQRGDFSSQFATVQWACTRRPSSYTNRCCHQPRQLRRTSLQWGRRSSKYCHPYR